MKMESRLILLLAAAMFAGVSGAAETRYRFDAGKGAPALYYDARRPIEDGSLADVAVVLIHGWGGHVRKVLPAFVRALADRAGGLGRRP